MRLLDAIFNRERSDEDRADRNSMGVRIDFFGKDEVSVLVAIDPSELECSEETAGLRLFAWYSLRQFHNLGKNTGVQAFASLLFWDSLIDELLKSTPSFPGAFMLLNFVRRRAFEGEGSASGRGRTGMIEVGDPIVEILDKQYLAAFPRLIERSSRSSTKSFIAKAPPYILHTNGFGPLGRNMNYYAPHSIIAFLRHLARKRADDATYLERLSFVAFHCGRAYIRKEIPQLEKPRLALQIVAAAEKKIPEVSAGGS